QRVKAVGAGNLNLSIAETLNHAEALEVVASIDVVVFPSHDEAMPTVTMLEAMSLGKAIVSTSVGGAVEFLVDGENALLVRPEMTGDLAAALARLIQQPELARKLGRNARATYE